MATATYSYGTNIRLSTVAATGYKLLGWASGTTKNIISSGSTFNTIMDSNKTIKAIFRSTTLNLFVYNVHTPTTAIIDSGIIIKINNIQQPIVVQNNRYVLYDVPDSFTLDISLSGYEDVSGMQTTFVQLETAGVPLTPIGEQSIVVSWDNDSSTSPGTQEMDVDSYLIAYDPNGTRVSFGGCSSLDYGCDGTVHQITYNGVNVFKAQLEFDDMGDRTTVPHYEQINFSIQNQSLFNQYTFYFLLHNYNKHGSSDNMTEIGLKVKPSNYSSYIIPAVSQESTSDKFYRVFTMTNGIVTPVNELHISDDTSGPWHISIGS